MITKLQDICLFISKSMRMPNSTPNLGFNYIKLSVCDGGFINFASHIDIIKP